MKTDPAQIELTEEQRRRIASAADVSGAPWPELLESALSTLPISNGNGAEPGSAPALTILDRLRKSGFLAALVGGPPDLSTNPRHMEGFGED